MMRTSLLLLLLTGCSGRTGDDRPPADAGPHDAHATTDATTRPDADTGTPDADAGPSVDPCAQAAAARSYVGCEYFAAPLANTSELDTTRFDYRIVVANPSAYPAEVTVSRGNRLETRALVVPGGLAEIPLPWIDDVSFPFAVNDWDSVVTPDGAYRVVASRPVIVTQYNPFHYANGTALAFTNDASLLLPVHALGTEHFAASYAPLSTVGSRYPGYIAVIGTTEAPATVEIVAGGEIAADRDGRWPAIAKGERFSFTLARGEVAQIAAAIPPQCSPERPRFDPAGNVCYEPDYDVTGSRITSDQPVAVFSGHGCAFVPFDTPACDHLETQLAPVNTWGREFVTMPMRDPATSVGNFIRLIAARDGTDVALDPPVGGTSAVSLNAGEHVELLLEHATSIASTEPLEVAQLLLGQHIEDPPLDRGDPALTILVPNEQHRYDYVFASPSSYAGAPDGQSYVLVSREPGVPIELDDADLTASWTRVADRELAIVPVGGGTHRATSTAPFGLVAYGLGRYTSYAAPAGLDLHILF